MLKLELLNADTIDCNVWAIIQTLKADIKMLEDKFDETDEYHYYQDARDLEMLKDKLERVTHHIQNIMQEYRP